MEDVIVNKIAESGIITIDLENFYPKEEWEVIDIKDFLFMEMILKEKDFRTQLQELDWSQYNNKHVAIYCSADALIPNWAYMLFAVKLAGVSASVTVGSKENAIAELVKQNLRANLSLEELQDKRVVVKGCGKIEIPSAAYLEISLLLQPIVKSLMYGEPCSTVPVYKKK